MWLHRDRLADLETPPMRAARRLGAMLRSRVMTSTKQPTASAKKSRRGRIAMPVTQTTAATPKASVVTKSVARARMSALDAAAEMLGRLGSKDTAMGLGVKELIAGMEKAGLWESPGGKTPAATLYSALIREITQRKAKSRFKRIAPGKFVLATSRARGKPQSGAVVGVEE
jgi:hypothetical protein